MTMDLFHMEKPIIIIIIIIIIILKYTQRWGAQATNICPLCWWGYFLEANN